MPTYEYECDKCGKHFEYFQSMKDAPKAECEACGGKLTKLLSAGAGLIFKGSGFYITDYKNSGGGKGASEGSAKGEGGSKGDGSSKSEGGSGKSEGASKSESAPASSEAPAKSEKS